MTYLELCNAVLTRLREDPITVNVNNPAGFLSDPYYQSIGAHVNDAKDHVENAWEWSQLRTTDFFTEDDNSQADNQLYERVQPGQVNLELPNSADNHFIIKRLFVRETGGFLRLLSIPQARSRYAGVYINGVPTGTINSYSFADVDSTTGNQRITLYPVPDKEFNVEVDLVRHQDALVLPDTQLKVPSLPVYSYATALASRERGEVGGTPTSELFAIAQSHLSDAIALDTTRFVEEMDFFSDQLLWHRTNLRYT